MKHTTIALRALLALSALAATLALRATPVATDTLVYEGPDTDSGVIATLAAGTEPLPPFRGLYMIDVPAGWKVVGIDTSLDGWVRDNDLDKRLNVKLGALLRAAPNADAAVIGKMEPSDLCDLRDKQGNWVQVHCTKRIMGYILMTIDMFEPAIAPCSTSTSTTSILVGAVTVTDTATATTPLIVTATTISTPIKIPLPTRYLRADCSTPYIGNPNPYFENQPPSTPEMQQLLAGIKTGDTLPPAQLCPIQPQVTTTATAVTTATESPKSE